MRRLIYCIIVCFCTATIHGQCNITQDPITNERVAKYEHTGLLYILIGKYYQNAPYELFYELKNNEGVMGFTYSYLTKVETVIPKGSEVIFKLENGELMKFTTKDDALPQAYTYTDKIWTKYGYYFKISKSDIEKLVDSKVVLVRFTDPTRGGATTDCEDYKKAIQKGAKCVTKEK